MVFKGIWSYCNLCFHWWLQAVVAHLCGEKVSFPSLAAAVHSLAVSRRHRLPGLTILAARHIAARLAPDTALPVLHTIARYSSLCSCKKDASGVTADDENAANAEREMFDRLVERCLATIDSNATTVVRSEQFSRLPLRLVRFLLARDSLQLSSELAAVWALHRWATRRSGAGPGQSAVLDGAQYQAVRWLTLSPAELRAAQAQCGLLNPAEADSLLQQLEEPRCSCPLPGPLQAARQQLTRRRAAPGPGPAPSPGPASQPHYTDIDELKAGLRKTGRCSCERARRVERAGPGPRSGRAGSQKRSDESRSALDTIVFCFSCMFD